MFGGTNKMFTPYKKRKGEKELVGGLKKTGPVIEGNRSFFWTNTDIVFS